MDTKLLIIGLDCAEPSLIFDEWRSELPTISALMDQGLWGKLRSTDPPITVPAWTSMMSSWDGGMLGCYGFRNRKSHGYGDLFIANDQYVKAKRVWHHLSRNRLSSLVFGVPQTYPPKPLNGVLVSSFMAPDKDVQWTYPAEVAEEVDKAAEGDYIIDVRDFRTDKKKDLLRAIYQMTYRRFRAFRHFLRKGEFHFAMMVEMGVDRIHHGFWRYHDKNHRLYEPGNEFENVILDYYKYLDDEIAATIKLVPEDCSIAIVSDHGAKTMHGAICINEWLQREGYLFLKEQPSEPKRMKMDMIDWSRTRAWGEGGYYSRIFFNVQGREPQGVIPAGEYDSFRAEIAAKMEAITDEYGKNIGTKAHRPEDLYKRVEGIPPDLIVYLGNLDWRSAGSVGTGAIHLFENDTGPDDANHAEHGMVLWTLPGREIPPPRDVYSIYDVAPSILKFFGIEPPEDMIGESFI